MFYRVCNTVKDYGKYIPADENIYKYVKQDKPFYQSIYMYTKEQVEKAQEEIEVTKNNKTYIRPRGIVGVNDVVTKKLVWDFDSKEIIDSQNDAKKLVKKLLDEGLSESCLGIYFSGGKGFHVEIETDRLMTPKEFKQITSHFAKDLKTYDSVVANPARIFRVPFTKHNSSGYYKTRLMVSELNESSVDEILEIAKEAYEPEGVEVVKLPDSFFSKSNKEKIKEIPNSDQELKVSENLSLSDFSLKNKPEGISNWKYALSQGIYKSGYKHHARMILAATFKSMKKRPEESYYLLKYAADAQSRIFNEEKTPKELLWGVIEDVYSPLWNGGTYSEDNFPEGITELFEELEIPRFSDENFDENLVVGIEEGFDSFYEYARNIDNNRLSFGIPELDRILKAQKGHLIGLLAGPGIGKCLEKGTLVLMFDGSLKKVEDIVAGDLLMGDDSTPRKVLGTTVGEEEMYRIIPTKGDSWGCNESHVLSLRCNTDVNKTFKKGQVYNMTIREYLDQPEKVKSKLMQYRVPVDFKPQDVPYSPYIVGAWLSEGSVGKPTFTCGDAELMEEVKKLAPKNLDFVFSGFKKGANYFSLVTTRGQTNPFLDFVREDCMVNDEKRIPKKYLVNSRERRLDLLGALLDGDGYYSNGSYEITTKYEGLKDDILYLCRSLGFAAYSSYKEVKLKNWDSARMYCRISISGDLDQIPCRVPRKKASPRKQPKNVLHTGFKVEKVGKGEYYGFELDGNHLYCLGDFTVTHNTSLALELLSNTSKDGCHSFFGSFDMNSSIMYQKLLQRETRMTDDEIYDVYRNNDTEQIAKFKEILKKHYENVTFSFKVGDTIKGLKQSIAKREQELGESIGLVVIDYIELILTEKSDATQASAEAAQGLREIANSGKTVVVLLQPNKMSSKADEAPKTYNAAKGSSAIAQAVTSMMGCFRPGYDPECPENDKYFGVAVLKNRMGPLGTVYFNWHGPTGRITSMEDIERQELQEFLALKKANSDNDEL